MQLGMIGLGRMGASLVRRLMRSGHQCVVHDRNPAAVDGLVKEGATGAASLDQVVAQLTPPRTIWLMVPAAAVDGVVNGLVPLLAKNDVVIDGGNSHYVDDIRRAQQLQAK
ncbi:MAG: NAD(P)-binding domain-containing protein, partial [Vicinamibacterales bacterium]